MSVRHTGQLVGSDGARSYLLSFSMPAGATASQVADRARKLMSLRDPLGPLRAHKASWRPA
jgi:hypothetical protein